MKIKMKVAKFIATYLIVILLVITVVSEVLIQIASKTILDEKYVIEILDSNSFYDFVYENIKEHLQGYIEQSGLDKNILENVYTQADVKIDVNKIVGNLYGEEVQIIDTTELQNRLNKNIENALASEKVSAAQQKVLNDFVEKVASGYSSQIYNFDYLSHVNGLFYKINNLIDKFNFVMYLMIAIFTLLIILINLDKIHKAFSALSITALVSGATLIGFVEGFNAAINSQGGIGSIVTVNEEILKILMKVINSIMSDIKMIAIEFIIGGAIVLVATAIIRLILFLIKGKSEDDEEYYENKENEDINENNVKDNKESNEQEEKEYQKFKKEKTSGKRNPKHF